MIAIVNILNCELDKKNNSTKNFLVLMEPAELCVR